MNKYPEVIIIGAGHVGLSASYYLKQAGVEHLVLERAKIGESWRSQRWDSFLLNTPNNLIGLPGLENENYDPEGFYDNKEFVAMLENYAADFQLPVIEEAEVLTVEKKEEYFTVLVSERNINRKYSCRQLIVCSGSQNQKKVPAFAKDVPLQITQLHASEYRNAAVLPDGAVLVVGSGQSGCQVAEDLVMGGKKVYLSTSKVARIPRYYRGKDILEWLDAIKFFDSKTEDVEDPQTIEMKPPQLAATGGGKQTISLQWLAKMGVIILGSMEGVSGGKLKFRPDASEHIRFGDEFSNKVKASIDGVIAQNNLDAPAAQYDEADQPDINSDSNSKIDLLDPDADKIGSVIWTTGFGANFNFLKLPVLDEEGYPLHKNGISNVRGLYFLGLPWLRTRKSGLLWGAKEDAAFIVENVLRFAGRQFAPNR